VSVTVCLAAKTLHIPQAGGALWVYLNWALGLQALGCRVIWLESVIPTDPIEAVLTKMVTMQDRLARYGFADSVALCSRTNEPLPCTLTEHCLPLEVASEADLLLNLAYDIPAQVVERFRRSALVDVDPGLTQIWISEGGMTVAPHDVYFTIGETVGQAGALFPDCGLTWQYTPPAVFLPSWPPTPADSAAPYTTVTNWWGGWVVFRGESYGNRKRDGFFPFLDVPRRATVPLELAISYAEPDLAMLRDLGWRVADALIVAATPWDYQRYIQASRGEFSCAKPSCVRLQNAWISDRTLCYLASGKPAVVQHTGQSRFLPDAEGLFRFRGVAEAVQHLEALVTCYERHAKLARALAEEYFDAKKIVSSVLERALT
jgi:hypothetical protein